MGVDQIVTNFKNTRENKPDGREFCAEGIHNVKIRWKYFTFCEPKQETTHKQEYWKHCGLTAYWGLTQCSLSLVDVAWQ